MTSLKLSFLPFSSFLLQTKISDRLQDRLTPPFPSQFVASRPNSPILSRPIPRRNPSQDLDISRATNGFVPKPDLISALEAQADEL